MTRIRIRRLDEAHSGTRYGQIGKLNLSGEYIPLFCIPTLDSRRTEEQIKHSINNFKTEGDLGYIKALHSCTLGHHTLDEIHLFDGPGKEAIKGYIRSIPQELRDYVDEEITEFNVNHYSSRSMYATNYSAMVNYINKYGWFVDNLGSKRYLINNGFIASKSRSDDGAFEVLFCLMIRRDAVKYYKQCLVLNQKPIGEIFSLYVNSKLVKTKESINEGFRRFYNKNIKPIIESKGLNVIFIDNPWKIILQSIEKPIFKSIREEKQWLKVCTSKFLEVVNPQPKSVEPKIEQPVEDEIQIQREIFDSRSFDTDGFREAWLREAVLATPTDSPGISSSEFSVRFDDPIIPGTGLMDRIRSTPRPYDMMVGSEGYRLMAEALRNYVSDQDITVDNNDQTESD